MLVTSLEGRLFTPGGTTLYASVAAYQVLVCIMPDKYDVNDGTIVLIWVVIASSSFFGIVLPHYQVRQHYY